LATVAAGSTAVHRDLWRKTSAVQCQPHRRFPIRTTRNHRQINHDPLLQCTTDLAFRLKFDVRYPSVREISMTIQRASQPQVQQQLLKNQLRTLTPDPDLRLVLPFIRTTTITMMMKTMISQREVPKEVPE
jgi:hypothetical protein